MDDRTEPDLDEWIAECVERIDQAADPAAALATLCATWPRHAAALRAALEPLCAFGLAGPPAGALGTPARIGEFEILRELGRGGMAVVYEARQSDRPHTVALKVFPKTGDPRLRIRFTNEARAAAALHHPHIVPIQAIGESAEVLWYAMQLIDGPSLGDVLARLRATAPDRRPELLASLGLAGGHDWPRLAARLIAQAAHALHWAHEHGVVHRDIKPGNLLLDARGQLLVTDFGLAAFAHGGSEVTQSGEIVGTLAYSSPEQVAGRVAVDERADVYSLGATLYEMVTLVRPFTGDRAAVLRAVLHQEPRSPSALMPALPRDMATIIGKSMCKEPFRRYRDAQALADDLTAFVAKRPIAARPLSWSSHVGWWCRRNPALAAWVCGSALLAVLVALFAWFWLRTSRERDRAVAAEAHLARQASRHQLASGRAAAQARQRDPTAGRRLQSLRWLAEVVDAVPAATADQAEQQALRAGLRSDVLAGLSLWDLEPEAFAAAEEHTLASDRAFELRVVQRGDDATLVAAGGKLLAQRPNPGPYPEGEFFADRNWVLLSNTGGLCVWHWPTGFTAIPPSTSTRRGHVLATDGTLWTSTDDNRVVVFDPLRRDWRDGLGPAGQAIVHGLPRPVFRAHLQPGGRQVAVLPFGGREVWLLDREHDRVHRRVAMPDDVREAAWLGDGAHLLVGGRFLDVLRVDANTGEVVGRWPGHHSEVTRLCSTPDGRFVATAGWDSQLRVWDRDGTPLAVMTTPAPLPGLFFSADHSMLGMGALDAARRGALRWRLHQPAVLTTLRSDDLRHCGAGQVAIHPRLPILTVAAAGTVVCFDLRTGRRLFDVPLAGCRRLCFASEALLLGADPDGGCSVVPFVSHADGELHVGPVRPLEAIPPHGSVDAVAERIVTVHQRTLRTWSSAGEPRGQATLPADPVAQIRLSPDGRLLVTGVFVRGVAAPQRVVDTTTGATVLEVSTGGGDFSTGVFSPDGRLLVLVRCDEHLVYATSTWQVLARVRRHPEPVSGSGAFSPDGALLVVPVTRTRLQVLDTRTFTPCFELDIPDGSSGMEPVFSADSTRLAVASVHRRAFVWDLYRARQELQRIGLDWTDRPLPVPMAGTVPKVVLRR